MRSLTMERPSGGRARERVSRTPGRTPRATAGRKADGTVFMTFERTVLVPKRGHGVDD